VSTERARAELLEKAERELQARGRYQLRKLFPDVDTPDPDEPELIYYSRHKYPKHLQFFAAGGVREDDGVYTFDQRGFIAGNRVGKSKAGGYESSLHLTGAYDEYAPWWPGRKFETPISMWAAGDTGTTTRDIIQAELLGPVSSIGSGLIPKHLILDWNARQGVPNAIGQAWIRWGQDKEHGGPMVSDLGFKSYDQRRESFQGTGKHVVWLDEECPEDVYDEAKLRTMIVPGTRFGGMVFLTFTPLMGLTPVVLRYMPGGEMTEGSVVEVAA
jgi:phage terminase large subunit-like protein